MRVRVVDDAILYVRHGGEATPDWPAVEVVVAASIRRGMPAGLSYPWRRWRRRDVVIMVTSEAAKNIVISPPIAVLPGVDPTQLFLDSPRCRRQRAQCPDNPAPRVGRIDDFVDVIARGVVQCLALLVRRRNHFVEFGFALGRIGDRREFVAVAEFDRALKTHAAEFSGRPGD